MTDTSLAVSMFEGLTHLLASPPVLTSLNVWENLFLAYYQHPAFEVSEHIFEHHVLEVIEPGVSHNECRMAGKYSSHEIRGGETFLCPAYTEQWVRWEKNLNFTVVIFDSVFFKGIVDEITTSEQIELVPRWNVFDPVIQTIVSALKADLEAKSPAGRLYGESFGTALVVHLLKNFSTSRKKLSECLGGLPQHKLKQVLGYIEAHLSEDISLENLATLVKISPCYFSRLFKQSMQVPPHQYIIRQRVELAKRLIRKSDFAIADISVLCGFSHQSHLNRHFKRIVGVSPNNFRNQ
jgi:AraC family transcriptional regulator